MSLALNNWAQYAKKYQNIPNAFGVMAIFANWLQTGPQGAYRALFESQPFNRSNRSTFLWVVRCGFKENLRSDFNILELSVKHAFVQSLFNPGPAEPGYPFLCKQIDPDQLASSEAMFANVY